MDLSWPEIGNRETKEYFDELASGDCRIERIVSRGQASPAGFWYDQDQDEWVALLQGKACLKWDDGSQSELVEGDWVLIPARRKHRVEWTSCDPPCIWLAVHGNLSAKPEKK